MAIAVLHQQSFLILRCSSSLHNTYYAQLLTLYIWDQLLQVNTTNTTATVPSSRLPQSLISPIYQMPAQNLDQQLVFPLHGRFVLWNMKPKKYMKGDHTLSETRHLKSWLVGIWQPALPGSWFHIWEWEGLWQYGFKLWAWETTKGSPSYPLPAFLCVKGLSDYKRFSIPSVSVCQLFKLPLFFWSQLNISV